MNPTYAKSADKNIYCPTQRRLGDRCINRVYNHGLGECMSAVRFILLPIILLGLIAAVPFVSGQSNGLITQTIIVQTINSTTGLPFPASVTITYTCSNPDGSWAPRSVQGWVNASGTFSITCSSPSEFNSWIHVYGQSGFSVGTTDYQGIPSQGGASVTIIVKLQTTVN